LKGKEIFSKNELLKKFGCLAISNFVCKEKFNYYQVQKVVILLNIYIIF